MKNRKWRPRFARAFTIIEMLVVVSIIALLVSVLLPAINHARVQAKVTASQSNLRTLGVAHATYASEWNDRQFTLTPDNIASYGNGDVVGSLAGYEVEKTTWLPDGTMRTRGEYPPIELGWRDTVPGDAQAGEKRLHTLRIRSDQFKTNTVMVEPIAFVDAWTEEEFNSPRSGWFRIPNARQFGQYLSGFFFDPVYFAPKDQMVTDMRDDVADLPGEYTPAQHLYDNRIWRTGDFLYASYSLSPAALFNPDVMRSPEEGGWQDPWTLSSGFRAPSMSQTLYPNLKTHMLEHHWLQNARRACNPNVTERRQRPYKDCQPYFFNQGSASAPVTLFYDGHVDLVGVQAAVRADGRQVNQAGSGLWSRDTAFGDDGYWISRGYDDTPGTPGIDGGTSFHILTTGGILGRDVTGK